MTYAVARFLVDSGLCRPKDLILPTLIGVALSVPMLYGLFRFVEWMVP